MTPGRSERSKIEKAINIVDNILAERGGSDLMWLGSIYYSLTQVELEQELSRDDMLLLTERIYDACGMSVVPLLTAERCDAVRFMLEYGVSENMSPEFFSLTADQAREVLLHCDMDIFVDLVDAVAVDAHDYYAPDANFLKDEDCKRINKVLDSFICEETSLESEIKEADSERDVLVDRGVQVDGLDSREPVERDVEGR